MTLNKFNFGNRKYFDKFYFISNKILNSIEKYKLFSVKVFIVIHLLVFVLSCEKTLD